MLLINFSKQKKHSFKFGNIELTDFATAQQKSRFWNSYCFWLAAILTLFFVLADAWFYSWRFLSTLLSCERDEIFLFYELLELIYLHLAFLGVVDIMPRSWISQWCDWYSYRQRLFWLIIKWLLLLSETLLRRSSNLIVSPSVEKDFLFYGVRCLIGTFEAHLHSQMTSAFVFFVNTFFISSSLNPHPF